MDNKEHDVSDVDSQGSDSVEEVISVRPIPTPRLMAFSHTNNYSGGAWSARSQSQSGDSGHPCSVRDPGAPYLNRQSSTSTFPAIIPLNVGGQLFMTRLSTLLKFSDSMLAAMFSGRHQIDKDKDGNFFLDSNGNVFSHILEYLRYGTMPPADMSYVVMRDANYYGLHELVDRLQLRPEIATMAVKEAQRAQFPDYAGVKEEVIKAAMARAAVTRVGDVYIHAFRKEFNPRAPTFNPKHGCIVENAQVTVGPWEADADEMTLIKCLSNDLQEEGFNVRPHEGRKRCKYYFGQTCPRSVFKLTILFD